MDNILESVSVRGGILPPRHNFIILGAEDCLRCEVLQERLPSVPMLKIPNKSLGLGDTFARLTDALRIDSCAECKLRRSVLNTLVPYVWRAPWEVREARNIVLSLGYEELPVLVNIKNQTIYDLDEYAPGFKQQYMTEEH